MVPSFPRRSLPHCSQGGCCLGNSAATEKWIRAFWKSLNAVLLQHIRPEPEGYVLMMVCKFTWLRLPPSPPPFLPPPTVYTSRPLCLPASPCPILPLFLVHVCARVHQTPDGVFRTFLWKFSLTMMSLLPFTSLLVDDNFNVERIF